MQLPLGAWITSVDVHDLLAVRWGGAGHEKILAGPGVTLGPAMTFACLAPRHLARELAGRPPAAQMTTRGAAGGAV